MIHASAGLALSTKQKARLLGGPLHDGRKGLPRSGSGVGEGVGFGIIDSVSELGERAFGQFGLTLLTSIEGPKVASPLTCRHEVKPNRLIVLVKQVNGCDVFHWV